MKCNKCGQEFGKGDTCQHCGADKVSALGEFSGYSTPNNKPTTVKDNISSPSSQNLEPVISQICWKCGEIIPLGKFCPACGQKLFRICPNCKTEYSSQYHICPNCGTDHREYEKAIALEHERQRKQQEAQEERERRLALKQKKLDDFNSYDYCALEVSQLIKLRWVSEKQREELLPLLKALRAEIKSFKSTPIDWQTDLTNIERAWSALYYSPVLLAIKRERNQREEEKRIAAEEKEKKRAEQEKRIQQADASWERRERYVSEGRNDSNDGCASSLIIIVLFLVLGPTVLPTGELYLIGAVLTIVIVGVSLYNGKKNLEKKKACTEHFFFWRDYPKQVDEIDLTEIKGKNAIITFDQTVKYQPQYASIRVMRGESFTIKSMSSSIKEIKIVDDYQKLNSKALIGINTNAGTFTRSGTSGVWSGKAFDIKFEAVDNMFLSQIDVTFDAVVVEKQKPSMELVQEVVMGIISKVMETHEFSLESTIGGDLNAFEEERMDICLRINNAFNLQLTEDRITESMTVQDLCLLVFNSAKQ